MGTILSINIKMKDSTKQCTSKLGNFFIRDINDWVLCHPALTLDFFPPKHWTSKLSNYFSLELAIIKIVREVLIYFIALIPGLILQMPLWNYN